jgi:predicted dehydrogenase
MPNVRLTAVCDRDVARAKTLARTLHCASFSDYHDLFDQVDAVSLAVPTSLHGRMALALLTHQIHVLIEKPIATTLAEANALISTAAARQLTLQVGHVERFNAAIQTAMKHLTHPRFIEVHRLSPYPFRGTDVSVVLDVMIHDLDLLLALVRSPIRRIAALGVPVLSRSEDIANARLEFGSGCVANLTASRISDETMRRIRVFQENSYLSIDSKAQTVELACLSPPPLLRRTKQRGRRQARKTGAAIRRVHLPVNQRPPLQDELSAFVRAIRERRQPLVSGEDGRAALALALRIERAMRRSRTGRFYFSPSMTKSEK